ncbi:MAG: hypothetical protein Q9217_003781 [Psora testacea]
MSSSSSTSSPASSFETSKSRSQSRSRLGSINRPPDSRQQPIDTLSILPNPSNLLGRSSRTKRNHIDRQTIEDIEHPLQPPNTSRRQKRMGQKIYRFLSDGRGEPVNTRSTLVNYASNPPQSRAPGAARDLQLNPTRTSRNADPSENIHLPFPKEDSQRFGNRSQSNSSNPDPRELRTLTRDTERLPSVRTILADCSQEARRSERR